jgi:hypothetical protein
MSMYNFVSSGAGAPGATGATITYGGAGATGVTGGTVLATGDALAHPARIEDGYHLSVKPNEAHWSSVPAVFATEPVGFGTPLEYVEGSIGGAALIVTFTAVAGCMIATRSYTRATRTS